MNPLQAGGQLGQAIFGDHSTPGVYNKAYTGAARAQEAMQAARRQRYLALIARGQVMARGDFDPTALMTPGASVADRANAVRLATLGGVGSNFNQAMGGAGKGQDQEYRANAMTAFQNGNYALGNSALAVGDHHQLNTTTVTSNGQVYNRYGSPDQAIASTDLGRATVNQRNASADASHASASERMAAAGNQNSMTRLHNTQNDAGGWNPKSGAGSKAKEPRPDASQRDYFLGTTKYDTSEVKGHARAGYDLFRRVNELPDTQETLDQYAQMQGTGPYAPDAASSGLGVQSTAATPSASKSVKGPALKTSSATDSLHPEGSRWIGPGGKLYVVHGGVPVLVQ